MKSSSILPLGLLAAGVSHAAPPMPFLAAGASKAGPIEPILAASVLSAYPSTPIPNRMSTARQKLDFLIGLKLTHYHFDVDDAMHSTDKECFKAMLIYAKGYKTPPDDRSMVGVEIYQRLRGMLDEYPSEGPTEKNRVGIQTVDADGPTIEVPNGEGFTTSAIKVADYARYYLAKCPDTRLMMAGWNEGARVIHEAMHFLDDVAHQIYAVATLDDPTPDSNFGLLPTESSLVMGLEGNSKTAARFLAMKSRPYPAPFFHPSLLTSFGPHEVKPDISMTDTQLGVSTDYNKGKATVYVLDEMTDEST